MERQLSIVSILAAAALAFGALTGAALAHPDSQGRPHFKGPPMNPTAVMRAFEGDGQPAQSLQAAADAPCQGGFADIYPCFNLDLLAMVPLADLGASAANDIWGWEYDDREFALIGLNNGTAFIEVTNPTAVVYIGKLPTHTFNSVWRDIKVYKDHAFIVSEAGGHGMQVFDLTRLLYVDSADMPFDFATEDALYSRFGSAHNIAINEESGFAYAVGTGTCSGGLHIVDISNPIVPQSPNGLDGDIACYGVDGYTHDVQCVIYHGLQTVHAGAEICFAANEDTLTIVDVTVKSNPVQLSRETYAGVGYTHQGWLDEAHEYFFLDDELDERSQVGNDTRTRVWDLWDLGFPEIIDVHDNIGVAAIDHNQYVRGDLVFQANYRSGLRVLEIRRAVDGSYLMLDEIGFFDVYPASDSANFNGAWSNYPYLTSGNILISGIEQGLFVVALNLSDEISIISPGDGDTVFGPVDIDIFARDGDLAAPTPTVEWRVATSAFQAATPDANNIYFGTWDSDLVTDGPHQLAAKMTDTGGQVSETAIQILVNNDPPEVNFVSPADGDTVRGNVTLSAGLINDDGTAVSVTFYDGTAEIGTDSNPGDGISVNWNTKRVDLGEHVLTVKATDNLGQVSIPGSSITVDVSSSKGGGGPGGGGGGPGNGGGGPGGGGGDKCFKNKEPLCP